MALSGHTWRAHPFKAGQAYIAKASFAGYDGADRTEFVLGKSYELIRIDHSHYDECTIFTFRSKENTALCEWWWSDREPESLCHENFQDST